MGKIEIKVSNSIDFENKKGNSKKEIQKLLLLELVVTI